MTTATHNLTDDDLDPDAVGSEPAQPVDGVNVEAELIAMQDALDRGEI